MDSYSCHKPGAMTLVLPRPIRGTDNDKPQSSCHLPIEKKKKQNKTKNKRISKYPNFKSYFFKKLLFQALNTSKSQMYFKLIKFNEGSPMG